MKKHPDTSNGWMLEQGLQFGNCPFHSLFSAFHFTPSLILFTLSFSLSAFLSLTLSISVSLCLSLFLSLFIYLSYVIYFFPLPLTPPSLSLLSVPLSSFFLYLPLASFFLFSFMFLFLLTVSFFFLFTPFLWFCQDGWSLQSKLCDTIYYIPFTFRAKPGAHKSLTILDK